MLERKYLNNVSDETKAPVRQMFWCEYVMTFFINREGFFQIGIDSDH